MSKKTNGRYQVSQAEQNAEFVPTDVPAQEPNCWVVLEDRRVCVNGAITQARQGKIIKDKELAQKFRDQGVKLKAHTQESVTSKEVV